MFRTATTHPGLRDLSAFKLFIVKEDGWRSFFERMEQLLYEGRIYVVVCSCLVVVVVVCSCLM